MAQPEYRGARGSNAGDSFHELWALRHALDLLNEDAPLQAITVEGLRVEDETGVTPDVWDGVDCTMYVGGEHLDSAHSIIIDQLKYSAADPDKEWTVARLTYSTNVKRDNSVIGRLAKAFIGIRKKRPDLITNKRLYIRLVTNQPIHAEVAATLFGQQSPVKTSKKRTKSPLTLYKTLQNASALSDQDFVEFVQLLDFSECGRGSRFELEERIIRAISEWTEDEARTSLNALLYYIRRIMLPESKGEVLTRASVLAQFNVSDARALFPCPSKIKHLPQRVSRAVSHVVANHMQNGMQRICLHGKGGSGKTTILQEIEAQLPLGSVMVIFDCYGGGSYLNSDAFRHRPKEAFLHLSNDLASRLRLPLLVTQSATLDYPRVFKKRLEYASTIVTSQSHDALLVIVIDAADNSVTAAKSQLERSFIHAFATLGELPHNVRFLVTARTGRLQLLELSPEFLLIEIDGFTVPETATLVQGVWNDASNVWIEDFHDLSGGNPRVQRYALDNAEALGNPENAINYLRPTGKGLQQIFEEQFRQAWYKIGRHQDIHAFYSGMIAFPRPVPINDLAMVIGLSEDLIRDLSWDLAPGIRLIKSFLSFADEDIEHFVRSEAKDHLDEIYAKVADHLYKRYQVDSVSFVL